MYYLEQTNDSYAVIWGDTDPVDGDDAFILFKILYGTSVPEGTVYKKKQYRPFFEIAPHSESFDELLGMAAIGAL